MVHTKRRWCVVDEPNALALAAKLVKMTWTLCTGFRHNGYLYLNDSFSEDGAQEYAVIREDTKEQVESITFSWCSVGEAFAYINDAEEYEPYADVDFIIDESGSEHECRFCA